MRVRVYDSKEECCFQSELYAILFDGIFERCLVVKEQSLCLYPKVAQNEEGRYKTVTSLIDPEFPAEWIRLTNGDLTQRPDFPKHLPEDSYTAFHGYPWVWENWPLLKRLLEGQSVPLSEAGYPPVSSLLPGWSYVNTPEEAEALLEATYGFHDSVLVSLQYTSGAKKLPNGAMLPCDTVRQVRMLFDSQWTPSIELVFEGVKALDLRPAGNNYSSILFEATCRVRDAAVFFCDGFCKDEDAYPGTKIWAYSLRWRFLPEEQT